MILKINPDLTTAEKMVVEIILVELIKRGNLVKVIDTNGNSITEFVRKNAGDCIYPFINYIEYIEINLEKSEFNNLKKEVFEILFC